MKRSDIRLYLEAVPFLVLLFSGFFASSGIIVQRVMADGGQVALSPISDNLMTKNVTAYRAFSGATPYGDIELVRNSSDTVYAITENRAILMSQDYATWTVITSNALSAFPQYSGLTVFRGIAVTYNNTLFVCLANYTESIILRGQPFPLEVVLNISDGQQSYFSYDGLGGIIETDNHTLFMGMYGEGNGGRVYESVDYGRSWTLSLNATQFLINKGALVKTTARHIHSIYYDSKYNRVIVIVGEAVGDSFTESILYSDDLGNNWNIVEFKDYSFLGMEGMTSITKVGNRYVFGDDSPGRAFMSVYDENFTYISTLWEYESNFTGQDFFDAKTYGNLAYFAGEGNSVYAIYATDGTRFGRVFESERCPFYTFSSLDGQIGVVIRDQVTSDFLLIVFDTLTKSETYRALDYPIVSANSETLIAPEDYVDNITISLEDYSQNFALIAKDDFEYGSNFDFLTNWTDNSGGTMSIITTDAYNGTHSLQYKSTNPSTPARFIENKNWIAANLSAGTQVVVGYAVNVKNYNVTSDYTSLVYFRFNYTDGTSQITYVRWHVNTSGWLLITQEYTLAKNINALQIYRIWGQKNQEFELDYAFAGYLTNYSSALTADLFTGISPCSYIEVNGTEEPVMNGAVTLSYHSYVQYISVKLPKFGMAKISYTYNETNNGPLSMQFTNGGNMTLFSVYYDYPTSYLLINVSVNGGKPPYNITLYYNNKILAENQTTSNKWTYNWTTPNEWIGNKYTVILTGLATDSNGNEVQAQPYLVVDPFSQPAVTSDKLPQNFLPYSIASIAACLSTTLYLVRKHRKIEKLKNPITQSKINTCSNHCLLAKDKLMGNYQL